MVNNVSTSYITDNFSHKLQFHKLTSFFQSLPNANNLLIWTELLLFTQFPSAFEFFFGLRKYQQIVYARSLFGLPALLFITNCGAFLAFKSAKIRRVFALAYFVLEFLVVLWFLQGKMANSLIALDSLGLFCALFMNFELGAFRIEEKVIKKD
jgi:hypothetical protein